MGVGKPDQEGPGALSSDDIHPIALLLEGSVVKVRKHIPYVTGFGAVSELAEAAVRLQGEDYDLAEIPFECTVTVYATDDEIDALLPVSPTTSGWPPTGIRRRPIGRYRLACGRFSTTPGTPSRIAISSISTARRGSQT